MRYKKLFVNFCHLVVMAPLILLFPEHLSAQKKVTADTVKLLLQIKKHSVDDTVKAKLYKKLSAAYYILYDPYEDEGDAGLNKATGCLKWQLNFLRLSIQLQWEKGIEESADNLSEYAYLTSLAQKTSAAVTRPILAAAEKMAVLMPEGDLKYEAVAAVGRAYLNLGEKAIAKPFLKQALTYFKEKNNAVEVVKQLDNLYTIEPAGNRKAFLTDAIAYARLVNNQKALASFLVYLGSIYLRENINNPQAIKLMLEAADIQQKIGYYGGLYSNLVSISNYHAQKKQYGQSLQVLNRGLALMEKRQAASNVFLPIFYWNLYQIYRQLGQYGQAEKYLNLRIAVAKTPGSLEIAYSSLVQYEITRTNYAKALEAEEKLLDMAQKIKSKNGTGGAYEYMGDTYARLGNTDKALFFYNKALKFFDDPAVDAEISNSIGMLYLRQQPARALGYFLHSLQVIKPDLETLSRLARAYFNLGNYTNALAYAKQVVKDSAKLNSHKADIAAGYRTIGNVYRDAPDTLLINNGIKPADRYKTALAFLNKSKAFVDNTSETEEQRDELDELRLTYDKQKDYANAYQTYQQYIILRDSIYNRQIADSVGQRGAQLAFSKKADSLKATQQLIQSQVEKQKLALLLNGQKLDLANKDKALQQASLQKQQVQLTANKSQLDLSKQQQATAENEIRYRRAQGNYFIGGIVALLLLSFFIGNNYRNQRKANKQITAEKQRSDDLLLNILPADVAEELKEKGSSEARMFDEVTVLFTDFVNFTHLSELLTPKELVEELNICFKAFDGIMATHHIEKIKTIGDAYLAVAGLPHADENHALNTVNAAKEIQQFIKNRKAHLGDKTFDVRIGVHSGSVVAGIVGVKKFAYDIWGDTVNTAARMEQNSEPGKINVSEKTYELVKDKFEFTYRGEIEAKNKGALKMYFVEAELVKSSV